LKLFERRCQLVTLSAAKAELILLSAYDSTASRAPIVSAAS